MGIYLAETGNFNTYVWRKWSDFLQIAANSRHLVFARDLANVMEFQKLRLQTRMCSILDFLFVCPSARATPVCDRKALKHP